MPIALNNSHIKLVSSDGHAYDIPENWAQMSGFLRRALEASSEEQNMMRQVNLSIIDKEALETVIRYMQFKERFNGQLGMPEFPIESDELLTKVLMAADFLEI